MSEILEAQIAALIAEIPPEERATFEAYYQDHFAEAIQQAGATRSGGIEADPDAVEEAVIEALMREADGRESPLGLGTVPTAEGEYELIPPETDPRTALPVHRTSSSSTTTAAGPMTPARWAMVAAALILPLLWLVWSVVGGGDDAEARAASSVTIPLTDTLALMATPTPLTDFSGGSDVTVAYPVSLEIARDDGRGPEVFRVLASASELGGTWEPELQPGVAAWLNGSYVNHVFCVAPEARATIAGLTRGSTITMRPASGAVRVYEVVRVREVGRQEVEVLDQRRAGLTIILCGDGQNTRTVVEAAYRPDVVGQVVMPRGQAATLPDLARLTVETVVTHPPTTTTPPGFADVSVTVLVENLTGTVWDQTAIADQLEVAGAVAERLGVDHDAIDAHASRRVTFRYRVPAAGGPATWRATALTGEAVTTALVLDPAPDTPPPALMAALTAADVRLTTTPRGHLVTLTATVTATGPDPVTLGRTAVSVWVGGRSLPLDGASTSLPVVVTPTQPEVLTIAVLIPDVSQLEVQIGSQRWRVTLP